MGKCHNLSSSLVIGHFCSQEGMAQFEDLASIVKMLAMNLSDEEFLVNVRRNHVLEDALRAVARKSFSCRFILKVRLKMGTFTVFSILSMACMDLAGCTKFFCTYTDSVSGRKCRGWRGSTQRVLDPSSS